MKPRASLFSRIRRFGGAILTTFLVVGLTLTVAALTVVPLWMLATKAHGVYSILVGTLAIAGIVWGVARRFRRKGRPTRHRRGDGRTG